MPVSLCEWRVRIGRFIHSVREYDIRERKEKLLKERIRLLKLLEKRLLEKKNKSEDEYESKPNNLSMKADDAPNESDIIDNDTTTDSHKEDISRNAFTIKQNTTQSTTCNKSNGTDCTFPFFFTLLISLFSLLLSLIFFSVFDFSNLLERYKPFLKWSDESSWRSTCLIIIIMCSNLAYIVLSYEIKNSEDLQDNLVLIEDENANAECIIKANTTPTESTIRENSTPTLKSIIIDDNSTSESTIKVNNTQTESIIENNNTPTESSNKENNTKTESTKACDYTLPNTFIKGTNTLSTISDGPSERKTSETTTSKKKTIKDKNTKTESTIKGSITQTKCLIEDSITQLSTRKIKITTQAPKRKLTKKKTTEEKTTTETTIKANNYPYESDSKDNKTPCESAINKDNTLTESTIKDNNNHIELNIKDNNSTIQSTNKKNNTAAESAKKGSNSTKESTIKNSNTPTKSTNEENDTSTESTLKGTSSTTSIKDNGSPTESTNESNNSRSESTSKDSNTKSISAIKERNTPSRTPTGERNNEPMKVNSVQAEYTIRSGTQKVLSDGKHGISSQIPSSLKGTTDDPVMQESTCLPEMILVKAGDVEQNPGPFDRSANIQEQELLNLAYDVPSSKYTELCIALGVSYNQSQTILDKHVLDFTRSLNAVFFQWKDRQRDGTDCRQVIAAALCGVNLDALGDKMAKGGYLPQEAAPTESAVGEETQTLTKEQVDQCAQDFRTFYRTRLCKIKTDPLDFNSILEFDRIYTNLVLLRNKMGTTRKTPLDYTKLLTTKVNGVFPKRLMVEGEGGAGKTTFCSKIAWDWAERTEEFEEFDWVLVIPFRNTKEGQTVGDIAKTYLSDSNTVQPCQIDKYILSAPSKVFIIFDGLDEYEGDILKESSDIAKILRSEKFVECRVLVTTRPWRATFIKFNEIMMQTFVFLAIAGFDKENISTYINKYFQDEPPAGHELINYIESNGLIQENMAPFPLYIAMLCILWRNSDADKRKIIQKFKTFSQLFTAMIIFLTDHCLTKQHQNPNVKILTNKEMNNYLSQIGKIAYSGVLNKRLMYTENDFSGYDEALEACCRIGVLSREILIVPRQDRCLSETNPVTSSIFFPHKLFQEYLAGMYLASLFESEREQYEKAMNDVIKRPEEFRNLLYFTASQAKNVAIDVTNMLIKMNTSKMNFILKPVTNHILVDIAFEAYDDDAAKVVGQHLFAEQKSLEIDDEMSPHTVSGYLFIMEKITMETMVLSRRSCGPTVSRDLADVICSSTALTTLELSGTALHDDFYGILESKVQTSKVERLSLNLMNISDEHASRNLARFLKSLPRLQDLTLQDNRFDGRFYEELASGTGSVEVGSSGNSVRKLHLDHRCHNDILQHAFTVEMLFPNLEHLRFTTLQTVSPDIVESLAHSGLKELSFGPVKLEHNKDPVEDEEYHVALVGDPSSLEQVFMNSFPLLTHFTLKNLVIGNNRCKIMLSSLKQHQHLENFCIIHCYTDEELDPIVSAINMEYRMKVDIQHHQAHERFLCMKMSSSLADALCHRTSIQELILIEDTIFSNAWFSEESQRTIDSKISKVCLKGISSCDPTASRDLARFICLQPCLTDLRITNDGYQHDDFFHEIAHSASSSKIQKLFLGAWNVENNDPTASRDLARFLCLQPCLTDLTISNHHGFLRLHDDFYHEIARSASSSKIQKMSIKCNLQSNDPTSSRDLARFIFLQPFLTDLTIKGHEDDGSSGWLHDEFYHEIASLASSSEVILASSSKIQKVSIDGCHLERNDPMASRDLARFICLQPFLTDLTIQGYDGNRKLHDNFYHELACLASSSKIQKVSIDGCHLERNDPTASRDLARFICLQPFLTDLTIQGYDGNRKLHDNFYHELACLASSSKVTKITIRGLNLDLTASRDLARFLCLQPCLTDLTIRKENMGDCPIKLHDEFYHELACLASSSKVRQLTIGGCNLIENDSSASHYLASFLCLQPCLTDLTIQDDNRCRGQHSLALRFRDEFYHQLARLAFSSSVQKLTIGVYFLMRNDPKSSHDLARFLCCQPCLTNLTVHEDPSTYVHEDFYQELARLASSTKVKQMSITVYNLHRNKPSASCDLARFLCLQPCLTDLRIQLVKDMWGEGPIKIQDEFYHELARLASSSKVQKLSIGSCNLERNDPTASRDLAMFLCLQPSITDLTIQDYYGMTYLHDDFYQELARHVSSSKVQKLSISGCNLERNTLSASLDLARFLCLLPCLTDLTLKNSYYQFQSRYLHDDFYHELARRASSSKIGKLCIEECNLKINDPSASRALAKFLCLLPCLTDLRMGESDKLWLHDDFYHELALLASSSKNLHLEESSEEWKKLDLRQQIEYIRRLVHPTLSEITLRPTSSANEPLSLHQGSVQQQIEYPSVVTPPDSDVPSTSGVNIQSGKIPEAQSPSVNQNLPPTVNIHLETEDSGHLTGNTTTGQQININWLRHGSKDDSLGGRLMKRDEKTNRKTDSSDEDGRATGDKQTIDTVSDVQLNTLAARIPHNKYRHLSDELGIEYNEASRILKRHGSDSKPATIECLSIWKYKTGGSSTELNRILNGVHLGDKYHSEGTFDQTGGELHISSYGLTLSIPPGALPEGSSETITLDVLTDVPPEITLRHDETLVSFGFQCLPSGLQFESEKPVRLKMPHCANLIDPRKVQVVLYSLNHEGEAARIVQTSRTCRVTYSHVEISLEHFSKGYMAMIKDFFTKYKRMSFMPFLPKIMPQCRKMMLQFRMVTKPHTIYWRDVHEIREKAEYQPAKDDDDEMNVKHKDLEVTCQLDDDDTLKQNINASFIKETKHTLYFELDFNGKADDLLVKLKVIQSKLQMDIKFRTHFLASREMTKTSPGKKDSASPRPSASTAVDIPPQGASAEAGEASTSKARPTEKSRDQDFDGLLKTVANRIDKDIDIDNLGVTLGFELPDIKRYLQKNKQDHSYMGTLNMLRDWRKRTTRSEEREQFTKALIEIKQNRLADELLSDDI